MKTILRIVLAFFTLTCCVHLQAQVIVPAQTDEIIIDNGASGKADPNDRIRYKVTIQNTGGAAGTGVQLNAVPDPRTTFVPGSFRSSPLAVNDAYTATGNVGIIVSVTNGVKSNDFDDNLAIVTLSLTTPPTNGTLTFNNDGSFTYTPNAGFAGTETFNYTMTDGNPVGGGVPTTDVATVTITVSNMIWFVDNIGGGSGGAGTLANPFKTLPDFNGSALPLAGHVVFIKQRATKYNGGIVLKNNMLLFGTGHSGGANLSDVLPFALAPNSNALPAINGAKPIIVSPTNGIALASGNTVRGVEVGYCPNGSKIFGNAFGTLTIGNSTSPDVDLTGNQSVLNLTNGAFAATSKIGTINSQDSSNIVLNTVSGTLAVGSTTVNARLSSKTIDIQNSSAALDFGSTIANHLGGGTVISITSSGSGSVTFSNLNMPNAGNGVGLIANAGGTINIAGTASTITARTALDITSTSFGSGATFASITSTSSGGKGVSLNTVTGPVTILGGSITNSSSVAFDVDAGSSNITYAGTISNAAPLAVEVTGRTGGTVTFSGNITNTGAGINLASNTGGTITFSGASQSLTTGGSTAVTSIANTGATVNFTGGALVIGTTSGAGFKATGGGTINVSGANNTIASTTGVALEITNTTIGASNVTFKSIAANGALNGIVLNTTGASGGLFVTGTGGTGGSGGTIQNITNRGVSATSTINLSLKNMTFTNANTADAAGCNAGSNASCNAAVYMNTVTNAAMDNVNINGAAQQGINLREVNGFQLLNSTVINCGTGGQTEESDLYAQNIFNNITISNSSLTVPAERAAVIYNTSKSMILTVSGSTFGMNQSQPLGADGLEVNSYGASNTTIDITACTFMQPKTNGLQVITEGTSFSSVDVSNSTFDPGAGLAAAIDLVTSGSGDMDFNITSNPLIKSKGINAVNIFGFAGSKFEGRVNNNTINVGGGAGSGAGVRVNAQGNQNSLLEIKNNNITGADDYGITNVASLGSGRLDVTVTGNTISLSNAGAYGIHTAAGVSSSTFTNKVCANVANNVTTGVPIPNAFGNWQARAATVPHEILLQGTGASPSAIWNNNSNIPIDPPALISKSGAGTFTYGATCNLPANPL
jgi:hypothetical protein